MKEIIMETINSTTTISGLTYRNCILGVVTVPQGEEWVLERLWEKSSRVLKLGLISLSLW